MRRIIFLLPCLLLVLAEVTGQSYGLAFNSHALIQENRTSLDLSPGDSLCPGNNFRVEFDLSLQRNQPVYFGYIFRLVSNDHNIDLICTQNTFKLVEGNRMTGIECTIDTPALFNRWHHFSIEVDQQSKKISLSVNATPRGTAPVNWNGSCFQLLWGANDHQRFSTRDLPPMRLKDVALFEGNKERHHWSLSDSSGNTSADMVGGKVATVKNPVWIRPLHQRWQQIADFSISGVAGAAFDSKTDRLFITGSDSMRILVPGGTEPSWQTVPYPHNDFQLGYQALFDTSANTLFAISIDQKKVTPFNAQTRQWQYTYHDTLLTEFWHANKFISHADNSIYIIGGYGQLHYKNKVSRYSIADNRWDTVPVTGDYYPPRYLAALGVSGKGDTAYIIGGYGSVSGDQMLNPGNYYDAYSFDTKTKSFKKLFTIDSSLHPFVFANSLVKSPDKPVLYGMIFKQGSFDTHLQLVEIDMATGSMRNLGDPIPYSFHDIRSFADLYYSPLSNRLVAVTMFHPRETDKQKQTRVKVFSIHFPPEPQAQVNTAAQNKVPLTVWIITAIIGGIATIGILLWKKKSRSATPKPGSYQPPATESAQAAEISPAADLQRPTDTPPPAYMPAPVDTPPAPISLFGQFRVTDSQGQDITKSFTPLLKELFLLVHLYSIHNQKGITSEMLNEILWFDKTEKDANNNRSVNLAKLKTILEKVGPVHIAKEGRYWQFKSEGQEVYSDYYEFAKLRSSKTVIDRHYTEQLLAIASKGPFLLQTDYNWLDDIKSGVGSQVIDDFLQYLSAGSQPGETEFVLAICNCIFLYDRLNEDALIYKCRALILLKRHALASSTYQKFAREYKEIYGEEFPKSFNDIIK